MKFTPSPSKCYKHHTSNNLSSFYSKHYIVLLSIFGFIVTGIFAYPFTFHWDNMHVFANIITNTPPNNWMGWFYPSLWKLLYSATGIGHIIGIYQNLLYWIAISILYTHLFSQNTKRYYFAFAFFPPAIIFIMSITNNTLLVSHILFSLALFVAGIKKKSILYLLFSILFLLSCITIRRDAIFLAMPILFCMICVFFFSKNLHTFLVVVISLIISVATITSMLYIEKRYTAQFTDYDNIKSTEEIAFIDLVVMSYYKKELLIPDEILKEEWRGENRSSVLNTILTLPNIFTDTTRFIEEYQGLTKFVKSNDLWHSGVSLKIALPIYIKNIKAYIQFRGRILKHYFFYNNGLTLNNTYDQRNLERINLAKYPHCKNYFLLGLLFFWRILEQIFPLTNEYFYFLIGIVSLVILHAKRFQQQFQSPERFFCTGIIIACMFCVGIMMISATTIQFRYVMPANILLWLVFVLVLSKIKGKKQILCRIINKI